MMNGNLEDFAENLFCGQDIYFSYKGHHYFMQSYCDFEKDVLVTYVDYDYTQEPDMEVPKDFIWYYEQPRSEVTTNGFNAEAFLSAPILDGKTFREIEKDVYWID